MAVKPLLGILASPDSVQANDLKRAIDAFREGAAVLLPLRDDCPVHMDDDLITWGSHTVSEMSTVLVHGFDYMDPVVPEPRRRLEWSLWQTGYLVDQQRFSTLFSLLSELARRGVHVANPPSAHLLCFMKQRGLELLREQGFLVPSLICSNDEEQIRRYCAEAGTTLWRPVTGRAAWQRFLDKQRRHLIAPSKPPILLAKATEGPLTRCWLFQGKLLLALQHSAPTVNGGERLEAFTSVELSPRTISSTSRLCGTLGASWLQVTLVESESGPSIYDFDCDPLLDWMPPIYYSYLLDGLAAHLVGVEPPASRPPVDPSERPTLFLRRMLQELFPYEESKYEEPPT